MNIFIILVVILAAAAALYYLFFMRGGATSENSRKDMPGEIPSQNPMMREGMDMPIGKMDEQKEPVIPPSSSSNDQNT